MTTGKRLSAFATLAVLLLRVAAFAAEPVVETKIGLEGVYYLRTSESGLVVRKAEERSPILLRIASVNRDEGSLLYELRYVGTRAGEHDLGDYLGRADGEPASLPPLVVRVLETLPADHDGSLDPLGSSSSGFVIPYRFIVQAILLVWLVATALLLMRQYLTRLRPIRTASIVAPTLAEQLQPLVAAALAQQLDASGQARLEMLLLSHWQTSLELGELSTEEALRKMRSHPEAGELLRELEAWLHMRPGSCEVDLDALLSPYRGSSPSVARPLAEAGV
jgi:AcrR family transcriptional regulator